ncbi:DHA2 family efflux MFS transporter permease subunit [Duganella radicis]|uniref:DHA2 family efflux MFS transporter permease subunit n=1 Tax=Duganella radicis TaxID=551988 RepID=A0A6L6PEH4_9BURK|nr:DHA2 family efflux MFS transporter permease subunit [Duganella radicis]MTV36745.1 DHA2 family efflux MFS transporter permease subunit [Duganella radicis]
MSVPSPTLAARRLVVATVLLGTLAVSLNNTALNPAMPAFMSVFGIDAVTASWVITAFMISMGMTMPLTGYLGNRHGKKRVYLAGLALFLAGSCLGALAPSMAWVIAARCIQGVAGGLMIPLSLALVFEVYPKEERGRVSGWWGMAVMLAPAAGPVAGGVLVQFSSWHALFAVNIPIGLVSWAIGWRWLPSPPVRAPRRFDWRGFALVTSGVGLLLATLGRLKDMAALSAPLNLTLIAAALLCLALFVRVELRQPEPLLNLRIFAEPSYSLSVAVASAQSVGMFGCVVLLPLLMHTVLGYGAMWTGLALFATALFAGVFSSLGGRLLDRHGPRAGVAAGMLCSALATMALGLAGAGGVSQAPLWLIVALMAARGVGLGLSYIPVTTAGLNAIPEQLVTEGSAMNNILRRVTASLAVVAVSIYYELRRAGLLAHGAAPVSASGIALNELFVAIGLLLLVTLPLALCFPKPAPLDHQFHYQKG